VAPDDVVDRPRRAAGQLDALDPFEECPKAPRSSRASWRAPIASTTGVGRYRASIARKGRSLSDLSDQRAADILWFYFGHQAWHTLIDEMSWRWDEAEVWLGKKAAADCSNRAEFPRDDVTDDSTRAALTTTGLRETRVSCPVLPHESRR
jgi:hypothetical protein